MTVVVQICCKNHILTSYGHIWNEFVLLPIGEISYLLYFDVPFLCAVPTGAPRGVVASVTSRSIMVSWNTINCIERNGVITGYIVEFREQLGARIPGEVLEQSFTATGLTPGRTYTFRVAGVSSDGTGPFTDLSVINTDEAGMAYVHVLYYRHCCPIILVEIIKNSEITGVCVSS